MNFRSYLTMRGEMSLVGPRPLAIEMRVEDKLNEDPVSEYCLRHRKTRNNRVGAGSRSSGAVYSKETLKERCFIRYILYR